MLAEFPTHALDPLPFPGERGTGGLWPSPALDQVISAVELHLAVARRARRTRDEYRDEATAFARWFEARSLPPRLTDLSVANADAYLADLMALADDRGHPWAGDTVDHHIRQLKAFASHAAAIHGLPANPLAGLSTTVARQPRPWRVADGLEDEEFLALAAACDPRDRWDLVTLGIVALGYEAGLRTSEHAGLRVEDFCEVTAAGRNLGTVVRVSSPAKRGPVRILPLGVVADSLLRRLVANRTTGPLFASRTGGHLSGDALRDRVANLGKRAGVKVTPQRLRRSAASWQATYGADSGHLDKVFGWASDPRDVKAGHYLIPTDGQLLHAHQARLSPLDRLQHRLGRALF